ncbi:uncharacterized protein LOC113239849 [Hyposmocoma kahamanoa]|uniref:uncharacterized protein LOC113239849 n=1 Tax=Hyposmocoma kahamanoa TaxID=1477025 RepID=UPI000E6D6531|nr:uncharacterized protein LOC113239849 [Hyposmocoma kahamanoa]
MVKTSSKSMRPGLRYEETSNGMISNPKFIKNLKTRASKKRTKCNTTPISNHNKNIVRKQVRRTVKKKKNEEPVRHELPKKIYKKTNNKKETQKEKHASRNNKTRKSTSLGSSSPKFVRDLKYLFSTSLMKSQYCNTINDIEQLHLTKSLIETISYPKFVFDDIEQDSNSCHGKENNNKLYKNEMDVLLSQWTDNKDTTSELYSSHSKPKTCPETWRLNTNDLIEERVHSSLDYCCAKSSKTRYCKTETEKNAKAYPDNEKNVNAISHTKLMYKLNIEFDKLKNDKCSTIDLFPNSDSIKTSLDANNDHSDVNVYNDDIFIPTKEEMKNEFVKGCDFVFHTFRDKVFETVYSDHLASVHYLKRILHG